MSISQMFAIKKCANEIRNLSLYTFKRNYIIEIMHPIKDKSMKLSVADRLFYDLQSGSTVYVQGGCNTPTLLIEAMTDHAKNAGLRNIKIYQDNTLGPLAYCHPSHQKQFKIQTFYVTSNIRKPIKEGYADVIPIAAKDTPLLFRRKIIVPDICLIHVTPPNLHGFCSLGPSLGCTRAALAHSRRRVAIINKKVPRTYGDTAIHVSKIDYAIETNMSLIYYRPSASNAPNNPEATDKIGQLIAEHLIEDGSTLQVGIGLIETAVLNHLHGHKDLGIHSEMLSDAYVDLARSGAITNYTKATRDRGCSICTYLIGSEKLLGFVHNNPLHIMHNVDYVNSTEIISEQTKMVSVNSCLEVDITGQVVSDSIGTQMISGVGGILDFTIGAAISKDMLGKPVACLASTNSAGESNINVVVRAGSGVSISRALVHYVVTEYGIAFLFGKTLRQRAHALINIAAPQHRETLEKGAFNRLKCMPSP